VFVERALRGAPPSIFGDGEQTRDFVYVANVVDANLRAAITPGIGGRVYNVACGKRTTLNELARTILRLAREARGDTGAPLDPTHGPPRQGDVRHSWADISRAQAELGYAPATGIEEGLGRLVEHVRRGG
jgi:nucleoside-diphosphate-sugar epimerase